MLTNQMVVFHQPKKGSSAREWEDGAGFDPGDPASRRVPRCIVVDGATEAYDSIRWVAQLVESFLGVESDGRPDLEAPSISAWFQHMQRLWLERAPATFASIFEERKFHQEGSFATLLGCELHLDTEEPCWRAVALGDAVLFHVRGGRLIQEFPRIATDGFGIDPDGVSTQPSQLPRMEAGLQFADGGLADGDQLMLCTDALASWAVHALAEGDEPWATLAAIEDPRAFGALVDDLLVARKLKNDDVTLLRTRVSASPANVLVVCH